MVFKLFQTNKLCILHSINDHFRRIGRYLLMIKGMFSKPENMKMYWKEFMHQCSDIGIGSLGIVVVISVLWELFLRFKQLTSLSPLIPKYYDRTDRSRHRYP